MSDHDDEIIVWLLNGVTFEEVITRLKDKYNITMDHQDLAFLVDAYRKDSLRNAKKQNSFKKSKKIEKS